MYDISQESIQRQREQARKLRKSQWWQSKAANATCYYCAAKLLAREVTMDHLVPLSRGGLSTKGNIVTACKPCNNAKKDTLTVEWTDFLEGRLTPPA